MERFARPGSESSPGAQHGVQAKDDLSGESLNRTIKKTTFVYHDKGCFFMLSDQNTGKSSKNQAKQAPERPFGCSGRNGRRNTFFNDCGHRLHSLYGGQPQLIIVGRVKRYY